MSDRPDLLVARVMKVGDRWPNLVFEGGLPPGTSATYDFLPDSRRAKTRKNVRLRPVGEDAFAPPRTRTPGLCEITLHFADGSKRTAIVVRFER